MGKRVAAFLLVMMFCTGCAKESGNTYVPVEEAVETQEYTTPEPTTPPSGEEETDNLFLLNFFVEDDHFFDTVDEIRFAYMGETEEEYGIRLIRVQSSDNLETFGEVFVQQRDVIEEKVKICKEELGYADRPLTYVCVEAEITSYVGSTTEPCLRSFMMLSHRVEDEMGPKYGLPDQRVEHAMAYTEFFVDCETQSEIAKEAYFISIEPGQTLPVRCLYIMPEDVLDEDIYMELYCESVYDAKLGCDIASDSPKVKYLKIPDIESVE